MIADHWRPAYPIYEMLLQPVGDDLLGVPRTQPTNRSYNSVGEGLGPPVYPTYNK